MIRCTTHRCVAETPPLDGIVVIIDVLRASNTVIAALDAGAAEVLLLSDLEGARQLKGERPDALLLGERDGITPPGFEGNNSPVAVGGQLSPGQTAILTTSAGTQAVARVHGAEHAAIASFANAAAVVTWIQSTHESTKLPVHLLAAGLCGDEPALEDDLCAGCLGDLLLGRPVDFATVRRQLLASPGADRLRRLGQDDDLEWCTRLDSHQLVPLVIPGDPPRAVPTAAQR
jgi:2-phosphosulfolactate phosphatase